MALVSPIVGNHHWWITGVYGPQDDQAKIEFLFDLQDDRATCAGPWLLGDDFNMILSVDDKNNRRLNRCIMHHFRRFTADLELRDIYLHGRRYTWSNEQERPMLVRNDRVLCTPGWDMDHPHCILRCLMMTTSDHCPLVIGLCAARSQATPLPLPELLGQVGWFPRCRLGSLE